MPLTLDQFVHQVVLSSLLSADDLEQTRASCQPKNAEALARELVRQQRLTAFQAQQCFAGKGRSLVLGNYVLLDKLGQGGMGMVLKAEHRRMKRTVALKVLSPAVTRSKDLLARFQREVEAAARLSHPNIVAAYDADEANGTFFLVLEYVEGKNLSAVVKSRGPLPVNQAVECIVQAARGLEYAHSRGVIHRDIKPANLLLDRSGVVKILDMGLARIEGETSGQADLTSTGTVMGTVDYMAPEQALSTKSADARSDIYSLGIALWYLLAGRPAYEGDSLMARLIAHREAPIPSLSQARPEVPPAIAAVFERMVAKNPHDRQQSMTQVIAQLQQATQGGIAPDLDQLKSEDNRLSQFLNQLDSGETATVTVAPDREAAGQPLATAAAELTTTSAEINQPTEPKTQIRLTSARTPPVREKRTSANRPPRTRPWWQGRRVLAGAGAAVAFAMALFILLPGTDPTPPTVSNAQALGTLPGAAPGVPEVAAPAVTPINVKTDLLSLVDPARDTLVFNAARGTWDKGRGWTRRPEGWQSGIADRQLLRLPHVPTAPSFTLNVELEIVNGTGGSWVVLPLGTTMCFFSHNGFQRGAMASAGFGYVDDEPENNNITTVSHPVLPVGQPAQLQLDVDFIGTHVRIVATVDGKELTRFEGSPSRLTIPGSREFADGASVTFAVGSTNSQILYNRVELTEFHQGRPSPVTVETPAPVGPASPRFALAFDGVDDHVLMPVLPQRKQTQRSMEPIIQLERPPATKLIPLRAYGTTLKIKDLLPRFTARTHAS